MVKNKRNILLLGGAISLGLLVGYGVITGASNKVIASVPDIIKEKITDNNEAQTPLSFASLSGFQPGAKVKYSILGSHNEFEANTALIDEFGNLSLPIPQSFADQAEKISYNFMIDQNSGTVNVVLTHDPKGGEISLEGQGTEEFTQIIIQSEKAMVNTSSDWAGIFDEKIKGIIPADSKNLKVAFFNMSPAIKSANDAMNSSVIEIQMLPGGGGPTDNNVNQFEMEYCGGPLDDEGNIDSSEEAPYLSMCDTEKFQASLDAIVEHLITPMQIMTEQLYFNAYQQVFAISTFFDAKEQMDAQRTMQVLATEANRDYQPSEQICRFGSYIKGVAKTEDKKRTTALAFNKIMMDAYTAPQGSAGAKDGEASAFQSRFQQFRTTYCNPADHNAQLSYLCEHDVDLNLDNSNPGADAPGGLGAADSQRMNKDIDFFRTLGKAYTLDIDFNDNQLTDDEEDVIALAKNLYWPNSFGKVENGRILLNKRYQYLDSRSFIALQNIAHNSFANMVSLKAKSIPVLPPQNSNNFQTENVPDGEAVPGWVYMKTMMRDFGLADEDIEKFIGREPSYYAQMDFLTKKLYQQPDFYTNLYDKEANIDRINVVLEAISLMQQRDHYENMLRAEMLSSALLQTDIIPRVELIQGALSGQ